MIAWLGKMAWRDSRSHRRKLLLFTSSISIGIGALVGLSSLSSTLQEAMDQQAAALLGADMALTSRQPFTPRHRGTHRFARRRSGAPSGLQFHDLSAQDPKHPPSPDPRP